MLGNRLRKARERAGLSQETLAKMLKIGKRTLIDYEKGVSEPKVSVVKSIAEICNVNPNWLLTGEGDMFRRMRDAVEFVPTAVPIISTESPAGFPSLPPDRDRIEDYLYVPGVPENSYALKVRGDSMLPTIRNGDYVIFVPTTEIKNGDIVIVRNEWNEVILRRYRVKNGEVFLTSDNPEYPTVRLSDDCRIIGRAVKKVRVEEV